MSEDNSFWPAISPSQLLPEQISVQPPEGHFLLAQIDLFIFFLPVRHKWICGIDERIFKEKCIDCGIVAR